MCRWGLYTDEGSSYIKMEVIDKIGLNYFDPKQAGVNGDQNWVTKAVLPDSIIKSFEQEISKN